MVILTRMMTKNIHNQVKSVLNEIVRKVTTTRKVSFTTDVVSQVKEYEVYGRMRKTPLTKVGRGKMPIQKKVSRCTPLTDDELRELKTPILCRTTPLPLSLIWKYADKLRKEKNIDVSKWFKQSEIPIKVPERFQEDIYP